MMQDGNRLFINLIPTPNKVRLQPEGWSQLGVIWGHYPKAEQPHPAWKPRSCAQVLGVLGLSTRGWGVALVCRKHLRRDPLGHAGKRFLCLR